MDLGGPRALCESLETLIELSTVIADDTLEVMAANYTSRIDKLEEGVEALSNLFPISYENLLNKPVYLQGKRGLVGAQGPAGAQDPAGA